MASRETRKLCIVAFWVAVALALTGMLIGVSIRTVPDGQLGILHDTTAEAFRGVRGAGRHAGPPFFKFILFPGVYTTSAVNLTCLTGDGVHMDVNATFQYLPDADQVENLALLFGDYGGYVRALDQAAVSATLAACGDPPPLQGALLARLSVALGQLNTGVLAVGVDWRAQPSEFGDFLRPGPDLVGHAANWLIDRAGAAGLLDADLSVSPLPASCETQTVSTPGLETPT